MCGSDLLAMTMTSTNCNGSKEPPLPRTKYLKHTLKLTLEEMFTGTTRGLAINKNRLCEKCRGMGSTGKIPDGYDTCEECDGLGAKTVIIRNRDGLEEQVERDCDLCWGEGEAVVLEDRCHACEGRKVVPDQSVLIVKVRRGTRHGQKIIYKAEGTQQPNMRPGDVVVILEAIDHPIYQRDGDDLIIKMKLDLVESLCGFEKLVTTLDKRRLCVRYPRGKVIQTNDLKYLIGEGMPKFKNPKQRGNMLIQFEVELPPAIRTRLVPSLEQCLPPRQQIEIPMDAVECNMVDMSPAHPSPDREEPAPYDPNDDESAQDQYYDQPYDQYEHDNGMHPDEQYDHQGQFYHNENGYEVQGNYEHASEYDQHYNQQGYDSHNNYHQEEFYQQEDDSLESYDATQQYRFND